MPLATCLPYRLFRPPMTVFMTTDMGRKGKKAIFHAKSMRLYLAKSKFLSCKR